MLASELIGLGDASEMILALTHRLDACSDMTTEGCRMLSMGILVLKTVLDPQMDGGVQNSTVYVPSDIELDRLAELARRGIESADSGVRKDSVELCVALHAMVGETRFWDALRNAREDPKNLITYYIARRQREGGVIA